jgi:hypothetical protein
MSLLGRVLQGIGAGLIEQGKEDYETQKTELLYQRELALKQLEFQHDDTRAAQDYQDKLSEISATGAENRRTDLFQGIIAERRDEAKDTRNLNHDITMASVNFKNDKTMEAFKQKNRLSEDQWQSFLKAKADAVANGQTVDRAVFSTNGQMQLIMKDGNIVTKGPPGAYNPSGSNADEGLGDYLNSGGAASGGAVSGGGISPHSTQQAAAPQQTTAGVRAGPGKAAALAQVGNAYAFAASNPEQGKQRYPQMFDPSGNLLPKEQIIARVNSQFGG